MRTPASRLTARWRSCSPQFPFMLGQPHYGAKGEVLKINPEHKGKIQLKFTVHPEPDLSGFVSRHFTESYMLGYRVAQTTGISGHVVSRITRTIFVVRGAREQQFDSASKIEQHRLKFSKRQKEVCGYTKRTSSIPVMRGKCQCLRTCMAPSITSNVIPDQFQKYFKNMEGVIPDREARGVCWRPGVTG